MKAISLLGSTGSIGTQTLDVVRGLISQGIEVQVCALAAHSNVELLEAQAREFRPKAVAMYDEKAAADFRLRTRDMDLAVFSGQEGLCEAAAFSAADITLNSVVGMVGLRPTLAAIEAGKTLALANKETLVAGGGLVTEAARRKGVQIIPVDSEHSAIFQCLQGNNMNGVKRLLLTASGGPFFGRSRAELENVTAAQALNHPNWSMGAKVTVDSATMMNKALEVMEACWLFHVPVEDIQVVVHRESIVHSMVEYEDNSVIAQMGVPDMRLPIQYALCYPKRTKSPARELDLFGLKSLSFYPPDLENFPCLRLGIEAQKRGGTAPAAVNAANEQAVAAFLAGELSFPGISEMVELALNEVGGDGHSLESVLKADRAARELVKDKIQRR